MSTRVLILGATSAIAADVARIYARRGAALYLVGRNPEKLTRLVDELGAAVVGSMPADLDDTAGNAARVAEAAARLGALDVAIIAQGLLGDQLATERAYDEAERVLRTNLLGPVSLLVPLANTFERRGPGGHIAVLSSVAGDRGRPRNYTYGAAKGALSTYLQGLRTRLAASGTGVHTIKLGPVDTPMTATHRKHVLFARPADAAAGIVAAIDHDRAVAYVPWFWRPIMSVVRAMPEMVFQKISFLSGR